MDNFGYKKSASRGSTEARKRARFVREKNGALTDRQINIINSEKKERVNGLRTTFIDAFKKYGFTKAKDNINSSFYSDEILAIWICEDVFGFDPNMRILNMYRQNNDRASACDIAREINRLIGTEVYTKTVVDNMIDRYKEEQKTNAIDRDDDDAR